MDPRESEAYTKGLEAQLKLRTEQLGQAAAVSRHGNRDRFRARSNRKWFLRKKSVREC